MQFKDIDLGPQLLHFWEWVVGIKHWNTFEGWAARVLVWFVVAYVLLQVLKHILDVFAKICESWKSLGFKVSVSLEERTRLRRRQQFCRVLISDLGTLAKAENWNDQFFTDLEAEVEAEGEYYASPLDRLFKRKSRGLRRVPSLIQAIETSTEQCLLVTGEPGSGKSVALRHLANQMAERTSRSRRSDEKIPLYLNLKELPAPPAEGPTADFIKAFVLENIRRGDADTAAYVRENWSAYRETGNWFFLFDSFDEIPAVLHAPSGSPLIQQYADAIRRFCEGMSECRGVLASREFKGPDALPWERLRILPLSPARQEELVGNSFLPPSQQSLALRHTASSGPSILTNPLFLTLLCRYVKDEGKLPINDNELLLRHIHRLACREPEYVAKRYSLSPEQLVEGSIGLAVLFAQQPSLSLAPTQDEISHVWEAKTIPGGDLERLLAALIDVKIGRCDVKEARAGDRRFTFAHRRYQETLFVEFLTRNPSYLAPTSLLTDLRWREYTVTLLQTGPVGAVAPLLAEAERLLANQQWDSRQIEIMSQYGSGLYYFEWGESAESLLRLLQEGLSRRLDIVTDTLREQVNSYLTPPWERGDAHDGVMVLSLGGLLPEESLCEKIDWAVERGTPHHWRAAFANSFLLRHMPEGLADWFARQLADRLLSARNRADVFKLEAIAARSPRNAGASWIVDRVNRLRALTPRLATAMLRRTLEYPARSRSRFSVKNRLIVLRLCLIMPLYFAGIMVLVNVGLWSITKLGGACLSLFSAWVLCRMARCWWLFAFRAWRKPITVKSIFTTVQFGRALRTVLQIAAIIFGVMCALLAVPGMLIHGIASAFGYSGSVATLYGAGAACGTGAILAFGGAMIVRDSLQRLASVRRLRLARQNCAAGTSIILCADSWAEVRVWMCKDIAGTVPSVADARSLLSLLSATAKQLPCIDGNALVQQLGPLGYREYWNLLNALLSRLYVLKSKDTVQEPHANMELLSMDVVQPEG